MNRGNPRGGFNPRTGARPEYKPGRAKKNDNGQIDQWIDQSPEPFRNNQPSANPRAGYQKGSGHWTPRGGIQGRTPPSTQDIMRATGHKPSYKPAGQAGRSVISGYPQAARGAKNKGGAGTQPSATKSQFKTNTDIFNDDTMRDYKRL